MQLPWLNVVISVSNSASNDAEPRSTIGTKPTQSTAISTRLNQIASLDEKQIQLNKEEKAWLYGATDVETKVVLQV